MMATVEQLVKQYETDKALQAEVAAIVADGKGIHDGIPRLCKKA